VKTSLKERADSFRTLCAQITLNQNFPLWIKWEIFLLIYISIQAKINLKVKVFSLLKVKEK
jgi:hypothetical protein